MSYKPEVEVDGKFYQNAQVFETENEAFLSAKNRYRNWLLCTNYRAVVSDEPVNYKWVDGIGDVHVDSVQEMKYA